MDDRLLARRDRLRRHCQAAREVWLARIALSRGQIATESAFALVSDYAYTQHRSSRMGRASRLD